MEKAVVKALKAAHFMTGKASTEAEIKRHRKVANWAGRLATPKGDIEHREFRIGKIRCEEFRPVSLHIPGYVILYCHGGGYISGTKETVYMTRAVDLVTDHGAVIVAPDYGIEFVTPGFAIHREDIEMCRAISEYGLSLVKDGDGVLTHCNAGPLATSKYGTGLGPLFLSRERGMTLHAWVDETRPLLQGARLTAYELQRAGVDCTLICDNMASLVMKEGKINACFVGCDRVAANGDTANKIGTSGVAILAKHYGIPFYVLGPSSTIDFTCPDGAHIPIELRDGGEIKEKFFVKPSSLPEVKCYNPAFDVTDHSLITAIVTEKGVCYPPFDESFAALFGRKED